MRRFPYLPPHVSRPKEVKRLYVVNLPDRCYFAVRAQPPADEVPTDACIDSRQQLCSLLLTCSILAGATMW